MRPICSHCRIKGHVIDKCYKLHGYPPGYRSNNRTNAVSNGNTTSSSKQSAFFASLNNDQYTHLMWMLQTHLSEVTNAAKPADVTHVVGTISTAFSTMHTREGNCWIIDSGASSHICHNKSLLIKLRSAHNIVVVLPNETHFLVEFIGYIHLTKGLILHDVLLLSQFTYNLLSVSALLKEDKYSINFVGNSCAIQDKSLLKTIGKVNCVVSLNRTSIFCKIEFFKESYTMFWFLLCRV